MSTTLTTTSSLGGSRDTPIPFRDFRLFEREAKILSSFNDDHPNIVRLVGMCAEQKHGILLLEFVEGGDLSSLLHDEPLNRDVESWRVRLSMALDIATGMDYLFSLSPPVHHLDLKPKNILINKRVPGEYQCKASGCTDSCGISGELFF